MTGDKRKARKLALNILDWLIIVALLLAGVTEEN